MLKGRSTESSCTVPGRALEYNVTLSVMFIVGGAEFDFLEEHAVFKVFIN